MACIATKFAISEADRLVAMKGVDLLEQAVALGHAGLFISKPNGDKAAVELPAKVLEALRTVLTRLVENSEVFLVNEDTELSPEDAAKILGISRPLVYQRMDDERLPFRMVGTHRRVLLRDVLALKGSEGQRQRAAKAQR